jgi:hypothetical protein
MTWNWFRHSNEKGDTQFSESRDPPGDLNGNIRTRPATIEELTEIYEFSPENSTGMNKDIFKYL